MATDQVTKQTIDGVDYYSVPSKDFPTAPGETRSPRVCIPCVAFDARGLTTLCPSLFKGSQSNCVDKDGRIHERHIVWLTVDKWTEWRLTR